MILGLNISHDASAALTTNSGQVIAAIAEERISRKKNHSGIPRQAIASLLELELDDPIERIVIGSNKDLRLIDAYQMLASLEGNPSTPEGHGKNPFPGYFGKFHKKDVGARSLIEETILINSPKLSIAKGGFEWIKHHDSHLGCALGASKNENSLLFSLDAIGDGESGAISHSTSNGIKNLARISSLDSLGLLYSAVTARYNFTPGYHEGKITGLAAFGGYSQAVDVLLEHVVVEDGLPRILQAKTLASRLTGRALSKLGMKQAKNFRSLEEIVSLAESKTQNYADLAYAIQDVTEKCILEIVEFWIRKTSASSISLSGGVFANVKINQRISESPLVSDVQIYPNMGDGGIALGGVWHSLQLKGKLQKQELYSNMFLAPMHISSSENEVNELFSDAQLKIRRFSTQSEKYKTAAELISFGKLVALHEGYMEFGPRALGSRSLLLDPRDASIQVSVNARLKRTEFMPFAPMVLEEDFHQWFEISPAQTMIPFKYMTMTCNVKKSMAHQISAVVHVDGTARPQTVNASENRSAHGIISEFKKITGIPLLVNTSLNIHEEPINNTLADSIRALKRDVIDFIISEDYLIEKRI